MPLLPAVLSALVGEQQQPLELLPISELELELELEPKRGLMLEPEPEPEQESVLALGLALMLVLVRLRELELGLIWEVEMLVILQGLYTSYHQLNTFPSSQSGREGSLLPAFG